MAAVLGAAENVVFKKRSRESIPLGRFAGSDGICQGRFADAPSDCCWLVHHHVLRI